MRGIDELRGLEDAVADLRGRLDARRDRVRDADEDAAAVLRVRPQDLQHPGPIRLARELDEEVADVQAKERGKQLGVVHVGAVRRVLVAARAGVDADAPALLGAEALEDPVVQVDERVEQALGGVELDAEAPLGEVELDRRPGGEAASDVRRRLADEVVDERLPGIAGDPGPRVEQRDGRRRDDGLLERGLRVLHRALEVFRRVGRVAERARGQDRKLASVAVREGNRHAARGEVREPVDRVGREARLSLLAVGDDGRPGLLEAADRVAHGAVEEGLERVFPDAPLPEGAHAVHELDRTGNAADGFGGYSHGKNLYESLPE